MTLVDGVEEDGEREGEEWSKRRRLQATLEDPGTSPRRPQEAPGGPRMVTSIARKPDAKWRDCSRARSTEQHRVSKYATPLYCMHARM